MELPNNQQTVMPYIILHNAAAFSDFMENVFKGELRMKHLREEDGTIQHAEMNIGNSTIMFAEASDQYPQHLAGLFIYVENTDQTYERALQAGAQSIMEPSDKDYGRTCGIKDPNGNTWWITSH